MRAFTGDPNIDRLILDNLDDSSLAKVCGSNSYMRNKVCNEDYFRNRTRKWFTETVSNKPDDRSWKSWYFDLADKKEIVRRKYNLQVAPGNNPKRYLDILRSYGNNLTGMNLRMSSAAQLGYRDLVDFFINKGANDWSGGLHYAAKGGHRHLVDFFIGKSLSDGGNVAWDNALRGAIMGGHRDLIDFFIENGANNFIQAIYVAELYHKDHIVQYLKQLRDSKSQYLNR